MMHPGKILKLRTSNNGSLYFKILEIESSTVKTVYICEIKNGNLRFRHKKEIESYIYKSEIGRDYFEVDKSELEMIKRKIQGRMLEDLVFFTEFYQRKIHLISAAKPVV